MTTLTHLDLNRRFAELCGLCGHEIVREPYVCSCGEYCETERVAYWHIHNNNPDFISDPRLVLMEMMKREDWLRFKRDFGCAGHDYIESNCIRLDYILDTTGLFAKAAIEWMEKEKGKDGDHNLPRLPY